jgi:hypothetical protein
MRNAEAPLEVRVAVLARDPETLDGVTGYLRAAGGRPRPSQELRWDGESVVVLFGDDFDDELSERFVREWPRAGGRRPVLVLVTSRDRLAAPAMAGDRAIVLLRRPVWGWVLLTAIRRAMEQAAAPSRSESIP